MLKITKEHYEKMRAACEEVLAKYPVITVDTYEAQGLSHMRFNWDVFHSAKIDGVSSTKWACDNLYSYLDDTHINSALAVIMHNDGLNHKGKRR